MISNPQDWRSITSKGRARVGSVDSVGTWNLPYVWSSSLIIFLQSITDGTLLRLVPPQDEWHRIEGDSLERSSHRKILYVLEETLANQVHDRTTRGGNIFSMRKNLIPIAISWPLSKSHFCGSTAWRTNPGIAAIFYKCYQSHRLSWRFFFWLEGGTTKMTIMISGCSQMPGESQEIPYGTPLGQLSRQPAFLLSASKAGHIETHNHEYEPPVSFHLGFYV